MGENRNPQYGERSKKCPLRRLRGHTQMPCYGFVRYDEALLSICIWETGNSCESLDPAARFLAPCSDLFIKTT
jgi:hypothetical protein